MMRDAQTFFAEALREHGVEDAETVFHEDPASLALKVGLYTTIGGEKHKFFTEISEHQRQEEDMQKLLAMEAQKLAKDVHNQTQDSYSWEDKHVQVHPYDGTAYCFRCSTEVQMPVARPRFAPEAEFTEPRPIPLNREKALEQLSGPPQALLRAYLIGRLRARCDETCPNNKFTEGELPAAAD